MSVGSVRLSASYRLSTGDLAIMESPSDQDRRSRCDSNKVVVRDVGRLLGLDKARVKT